jgi:hypothetical protein
MDPITSGSRSPPDRSDLEWSALVRGPLHCSPRFVLRRSLPSNHSTSLGSAGWSALVRGPLHCSPRFVLRRSPASLWSPLVGPHWSATLGPYLGYPRVGAPSVEQNQDRYRRSASNRKPVLQWGGPRTSADHQGGRTTKEEGPGSLQTLCFEQKTGAAMGWSADQCGPPHCGTTRDWHGFGRRIKRGLQWGGPRTSADHQGGRTSGTLPLVLGAVRGDVLARVRRVVRRCRSRSGPLEGHYRGQCLGSGGLGLRLPSVGSW